MLGMLCYGYNLAEGPLAEWSGLEPTTLQSCNRAFLNCQNLKQADPSLHLVIIPDYNILHNMKLGVVSTTFFVVLK